MPEYTRNARHKCAKCKKIYDDKYFYDRTKICALCYSERTKEYKRKKMFEKIVWNFN